MKGNGDIADFVSKIQRPSQLYFQKIHPKNHTKITQNDQIWDMLYFLHDKL